jgi:hypothetical protein
LKLGFALAMTVSPLHHTAERKGGSITVNVILTHLFVIALNYYSHITIVPMLCSTFSMQLG